MKTILVTGSTGTVGSSLVEALAKKSDVTLRVATRDPSKHIPAGEPVAFAWDDAQKLAAAVKGADVVFVLTPFVDVAVEYTKNLVEAAKASGVKKLVKLSAAGALEEGSQLSKWHRDAERLLEASGLAWVTLRPNFFMSNFVHYYPPDASGAIYLPTGEGKAAWVHPLDIGEVAAEAILRSDYDGKALDITGPAALSVADVAAVLSEASGRAIKHVDVPAEAARAAMDGMHMPDWMVQGMLDLHDVIKHNRAAATTSVVQDVTGLAPRSFAEFAREQRAAFAAK